MTDKNNLFDEEYNIFKEHESRTPRYDIFTTLTRNKWLSAIFSNNTELNFENILEKDDYYEDLLLTMERDLELAKLYMGYSIALIELYGRNHGMPNEIIDTIRRQAFIEIAKANSINDLHHLIIATSTKVHKLYVEHNSNIYSYEVIHCMEIIQRNRYEKITLNLLANQVGLNPTYLSRKFHCETGLTISEYITNVKMEEADILLKNHIYSIDYIADLFSYDKSYFKKVYKKWLSQQM
ncbi:MAG: helix-turn-helix transcriptional regulator [Lachnospiraceae bacterium]|nr:helix-turn-helix transcriptional regulator [Lachnospiraceae bacterium]